MPTNIVSPKLLSRKNSHAENFFYPSLKTFSDGLLEHEQEQDLSHHRPAVIYVTGHVAIRLHKYFIAHHGGARNHLIQAQIIKVD
jgi:hypothetical protein